MIQRDWAYFRFSIMFSLLLAGAWRCPYGYSQSRIDLEIVSIQVQTPQLASQRNVAIVATIRNNGSQAVENVSLQVTLKQNGKTLKAIKNIPVLSRLPRLGSSQSLPITLGALEAGQYEIFAIVDPDNQFSETDEENNQRKVNFNVAPFLGK